MSSFENSHHFNINGGTFYNAQTAYHALYMSIESASHTPMSILLRHTAINASHESPHDAYEPRCSPGTRKEVIADILAWAGENDTAPPIAWLSVPAGAGKTSIQSDVATALHHGMNENGESSTRDCPGARLAGSYFFSGRLSSSQSGPSNAAGTPSTSKLDTIQPFIATVAYQMTITIPGLRQHIEKAIEKDPLVFGKGVSVQAQKVLMEPLQKWKSDMLMEPLKEVELPRHMGWWRKTFKRLWARAKRVGGKALRANVMEPVAITSSAGNHTIHALARFEPFPLRFIIASRPELDLTDIFTSPTFASDVRRIRLEEYESHLDIDRFLRAEFARIRSTHPAKALLSDWPSEDDIYRLVWKSSGQFIYASTIIRFVGNPRVSPIDLLRRAMHNPAEGEWERTRSPVAGSGHLDELYNIYSLILAGAKAHRPTLRRILQTIAYNSFAFIDTTYSCDEFLSYPAGTTSMAICDLHSLIHVPSTEDIAHSHPDESGQRKQLNFFHQSFEDYLYEPSAAGDLTISRMSAFTDFTQVSIAFVLQWVEDGCPVSPIWMYRGETCNLFLTSILQFSSLEPEDLKSLPQDILSFDLSTLSLLNFVHLGKPWAPHTIGVLDEIDVLSTKLEDVHPNSPLCRSLAALLDVESRAKKIWSQERLEHIQTMTQEERRSSPCFEEYNMLLGNAATVVEDAR